MMRKWIVILGVILMAQPVLIRYTLGTKTVEIPAHYAGGLEGSFVPGVERGAVRLICHDPLWKNVHETAVSLTTSTSLSVSYLIGRVGGSWVNFGNGGTGTVFSAIYGPDDSLYIGGTFNNWAGDASQDKIAQWNGTTWSALGSGLGGLVSEIVFDAGGNLYAGGDFITGSGVTLNRLGKWDGSTWSALGTGLNGGIRALAFDSQGNLYAGGLFTTAGGNAANYIAKWDGSSWSALGSGLGLYVYALAIDSQDNVYAGGSFTTAGGSAASKVAMWDGSTWSALGSGVNDDVQDLIIDINDDLYVAGNFTTAGGNTANHIAKWNGSVWSTLGSGANDDAYRLRFDTSHNLWMSGKFTQVGGLTTADHTAIWNGTTWTPFPVDLPGTPIVYAITIQASAISSDDIVLGYDTTGTATIAGSTTSVTNNGSAPAYPTIKIKRSGGTSATLETIRNEDSRLELLFNLAILDGETIIINLENKTVTSDYRGDLIGKLLPNSDFQDWALLPGTNDIYTYISTAGSPTITATMRWRECFWSVDDA